MTQAVEDIVTPLEYGANGGLYVDNLYFFHILKLVSKRVLYLETKNIQKIQRNLLETFYL